MASHKGVSGGVRAPEGRTPQEEESAVATPVAIRSRSQRLGKPLRIF